MKTSTVLQHPRLGLGCIIKNWGENVWKDAEQRPTRSAVFKGESEEGWVHAGVSGKPTDQHGHQLTPREHAMSRRCSGPTTTKSTFYSYITSKVKSQERRMQSCFAAVCFHRNHFLKLVVEEANSHDDWLDKQIMMLHKWLLTVFLFFF